MAALADNARSCSLAQSSATTWLVDGHVHIHPSYDVRQFLDAAAANFEAAAQRIGVPAGTPGVLMLTESAGVDAFAGLARQAGGVLGEWTISRTAETVSLAMTRSGAPRVYLVAGRQIVTADRLEVLALASGQIVPDDLPLEAAVSRVQATGALAVIPWGFGKWTGRRRRRLAEFLQSAAGDGVLLGDNGGRLAVGPTPPLLREARERGLPVVPGSDPLPFASHAERAGRYGFVLEAAADPDHPARTVVQYLLSRKDQPCPYGRLTPLPAFLVTQLRMQLRARFPKR